MGRVKTGKSKKAFIREHDCRFCLYYGSCARKECMFDGAGGAEVSDCGENAGSGSDRGSSSMETV